MDKIQILRIDPQWRDDAAHRVFWKKDCGRELEKRMNNMNISVKV